MQAPANFFEETVHDLVAAHAARPGRQLLSGVFRGESGGFEAGGVELFGARAVLGKNFRCALRVLLQLLQHHVPETYGMCLSKLRIPVLFVGKIASQGGALAADRHAPTLKVGEGVCEPSDVA